MKVMQRNHGERSTVKILNLSFEDSAGAAYTLSHALNKVDGISAINLRSNDNYIGYPTIAEVRHYNEASCRQMVYDADVVVFHTAVLPFYSALHLDKQRMLDKKKLLYFHGSDCRTFGDQIMKQADEWMGKHEILVSTPDLKLQYAPSAHWMPVARSFSEIKREYSLCNQDMHALKAFKAEKTKVLLGHAPTSQARKGSDIFYKVITELVESFPNAEYVGIQNQPWSNCLRQMSRLSIFYDQCLIGAYGLAAVEAAIFKVPVFCLLDPDVMKMMEVESGLPNPFIQFANQVASVEKHELIPDTDILRTQSFMLVDNPKLRRKFGAMAYEYCKKMHDEDAVAKRFLKIVEGMD